MSKKAVEKKNVVASVPEYKPTSVDQRKWLLKNGFTEEQIPATAYESMKLMDKIIAAQKLRRNEPPTGPQLNFLEDHGYNRAAMSQRTKGYCSSLINNIKKGKVA